MAEKFKYYDEYIANNKINIKNLLSQLFNLLVQFKEKINLLSKNNSYFCESISRQFISEIDKIISQINAINNISNYDIELNDSIFFDTINRFISLLFQEFNSLYNKNYNYKKYNFSNTKNEEIKNNNDEFLLKTNYINNERIDYVKDYSELKKKNQLINKENSKLKNEILILGNELKEMTLKYNCNQKTVLVNNEGKKMLLNTANKFIKNISDKEIAKIMYDILNIIDQINLAQLNKGIVEEKLNLMENNENLMEDKDNELGIYLLNERNKLKKLIDDYNNKINDKNNILQQLNEEYNKKEIVHSNYVKELKEKNDFLFNDNEELRKKIDFLEKENYAFKDIFPINNKNNDKETFYNSSKMMYNKTVELLDNNKKINNFGKYENNNKE